MFGFGGRRTPFVNGAALPGTGITAPFNTVGFYNVHTNIDAGIVWGPVAGRGAIASITWDSPGAKIKPTAPSEVFYTTATAGAMGELKVEWNAPYSDGGSPITGWEFATYESPFLAPIRGTTVPNVANETMANYQTRLQNTANSLAQSAVWAPMNAANGTSFNYSAATNNGSYNITRQSNGDPFVAGTEYFVVVRAVNAVGSGAFAGQTAAQGANTTWPFTVPARVQRVSALTWTGAVPNSVPTLTILVDARASAIPLPFVY